MKKKSFQVLLGRKKGVRSSLRTYWQSIGSKERKVRNQVGASRYLSKGRETRAGGGGLGIIHFQISQKEQRHFCESGVLQNEEEDPEEGEGKLGFTRASRKKSGPERKK